MPDNKKKNMAEERRRVKRTAVQESFQLFLVIPKIHGMAKVYMKDLSWLGLCFSSEVEDSFSLGQAFQIHLYIGQAFYLPLECKVVRKVKNEIAVEFLEPKSPEASAVARLQDFFEAAEKVGVVAG